MLVGLDENVSAETVAARLREAFPGERPSALAGRLGIRIEFGEWFPVTAGEYESAVGRITVNRRAPVDVETVIAHELGHHCLERLGRIQDERFCDEFAEALTGEF